MLGSVEREESKARSLRQQNQTTLTASELCTLSSAIRYSTQRYNHAKQL